MKMGNFINILISIFLISTWINSQEMSLFECDYLGQELPFISADESFMIFDRRPSTKGNPADLFITFRNSNDTWTEPVRLGEEINTSALETNAFVTPDENYMFFTRKFDIYWVKADFIGKIKNQVLK